MRLGISPILLLVLFAFSPPSTRQLREEQIPELLNEQHGAAERYREGRTAEALAILERHATSVNVQLARFVAASLRGQLRLRIPEGMSEPRPWTPELAHSLAALRMEAALRKYERRDSIDRFRAEAGAAQELFSLLSTQGHVPSDQWSRWMLAIGGLASAEGQLWWATAILEEPCGSKADSVALLIACGAVHEATAALPAHGLLRQVGDAEDMPVFGVRSYQDASARRRRHLADARGFFEEAARLDAGDSEARLRLAHTQLESGNVAAASTLLQDLMREQSLDRRAAFLSRLLLGKARDAAGDGESAIALFREAVALVPSAQSAHVAVAAALHRQGKFREAAGASVSMFGSPSTPLDPWLLYHHGQYWLVDPLLDELRSEARR
jgi:tetratricopeptide (TPR) repeat protein